MDAIIRDPSNGYGTKVNSEGLLKSYSVTEEEGWHVNEDHAQAYSARITQAPTAADDCIAYIENTSNNPLVVCCINIMDIAGNLEFYMKLSDKGTRNNASDVTPVCLNSGKGNVADCTFEQGADLDGGAATLSGGSEVYRWNLLAAESSKDLKLPIGIILEKNQTVTFWADQIQEVDFTVSFYFHQ